MVVNEAFLIWSLISKNKEMERDKKEDFKSPENARLIVLDMSKEELHEMCATKIKHLISIIDRLFERTSTLGRSHHPIFMYSTGALTVIY